MIVYHIPGLTPLLYSVHPKNLRILSESIKQQTMNMNLRFKINRRSVVSFLEKLRNRSFKDIGLAEKKKAVQKELLGHLEPNSLMLKSLKFI